MTTTVIDSLIVTLGLDPSGFKKGQKETDKALDASRKKVVSAATDMGKAITQAAKQFSLAFLGFESASGLTRMLAGLNETTRQLGLISKNTDNSASELRNWANAARVAGGTSEDFLNTIQAIQKEQSTLQTTGNSGWIGYLRQLNVGLLDATTGKARNQLDVMRDLATAYQRVAKEQGRPQANSLGLAMGIDQNTMNFLLQGPEKIAAMVKEQEAQYQVTDQTIEASAKLRASWEALKIQGESLGLVMLEKLQPAIQGVFDWFQKLGSSGGTLATLASTLDILIGTLGRIIEGWKGIGEVASDLTRPGGHYYEKLPDWWKKSDRAVEKMAGSIFGSVGEWLKGGGPAPNKPAPAVGEVGAQGIDTRARSMRNNNPGNIMAVGSQPRDKDGFRIFPNMGEGINAANSQLDRYASRGINSISGIINTWSPANGKGNTPESTANYIKRMTLAVGKNADDVLTPADRQKLLRAMFLNEGGGSAPSAATISTVLAANPAALTAARGSGAGAAVSPLNGSNSSVSNAMQIDQINIHTGATDANGIADSIKRSLERKNLVANADYGQN